MEIQLSDHFTYKKLYRFVLPSIVMMVFTSIYGVVDGFFVSNFAGKSAFAAVNLVMPFIMILGGMGFMAGTGGKSKQIFFHDDYIYAVFGHCAGDSRNYLHTPRGAFFRSN